MASTVPHRLPAAHRASRGDEFIVLESTRSLGRNAPQRIGRRLWGPTLVMALIAFPAGVVLAVVRAQAIADEGSEKTIAALQHFVPATMFLGFAAVLAAVSFAIARILGEFRKGGGDLQETAGVAVQTLRMPWTARAFLGLMATAMMALLAAVALHVVIGTAIATDSGWALDHSEQWAVWLEGVRRLGVAVYLLAISLGLATIVTVLRFQAVRIREVPTLPRQE